MENKIKFSREEQKDFNFWKQDGNVSKNEDGSYSTQDSQWTNRLKDLDALKQYYYKEFISDTPRYAGGGRTMKNRAKKQAIKDIKSNLWRPQAPYQSVEKPSEEWERYELPYDTKLQYDFEPDSFSVQGKRYSEYAKGGEIKVNGMTKQDYIDAFQNRVEKLIQELKKEGTYDEKTFDFIYEIVEKNRDGGFTDIEDAGFYLSSQSIDDGYDNTAYYLSNKSVGYRNYTFEFRNYTEKVLSHFYFGKPMKIEFVMKTSGDTELALEDELQKIKLLSNKIDFNKVVGVIDYEKKTDNTDLDFYKDIELVMSLNGDWDETTEELDTIIDVNGEMAYLNYHPLDSMGGVNMQQLKKNINEAFKELNTYSAVVSIEGYEEYAEDVEGLENAKSVIQDIKGNTRFQVLKGSSVGIGKRVDTSRVVEEFAKGGEAGFDDAGTSLAMYHETKGNWLVPKGQVYLWLYDVENSAEKIESGEFDYVQYPLTSMSMAWQRGYIPPLKRIWTKKFQKMNKGSEHLLGVIKAFLIEEDGKKELYIDMMSVNPTKKKKGVMSYMIKDLRDTFNLTQDQVTFSNLTEDGKKFVVKKTYADGGGVSVLSQQDEIELNDFWEDMVDGEFNIKQHKEDFISSAKEKFTNISEENLEKLFYRFFDGDLALDVEIKSKNLEGIIMDKFTFDDAKRLANDKKKYGWRLPNLSEIQEINYYGIDNKIIGNDKTIISGSYWINISYSDLENIKKNSQFVGVGINEDMLRNSYFKYRDSLDENVESNFAWSLLLSPSYYYEPSLTKKSSKLRVLLVKDKKLKEDDNKYADGGEASELNIGQIFEVNRDSEKGKKYFDFHYGKGYVFIISDIFNEKVIDENQFWDAHIKLKVYDSNLKYIFPIRVFFKGKPYGLNLTKKLFSELLSDKSIFPSDNYYVEKESDYDRQEREFKGNGYVELIKRKINPIWKSIIDKFSEIYFSNGTDNDYLVSDQVKARGSNPYSSYEFRNFSPLLSWADAEGKFKQSLTADELNSIEISYNTEEYADLEEHDTEKYHKQIVVKLKTYADGGQPVQYVPVQQMPQQPVQYVPVQQMPQQSPQQPVNSPLGNLDINSAINFVKENPQVLALLKDGGEASEFKKGGNVSSIEKRVAEVNALIKEGNDKGVQVIDKTTTWEAPMKYNPIKYTNGVLYVSYKQLDLYKYKKGMGSEWKNESYRIGKKELGENISRGSAQTDALSYIARMYRSAINDFNKYGYNGGGRVKTKEYFQIYKLEDLRKKTELLLTDVELNKFIDTWNLDYNTDYADWIEFNEYEDSVKITPVFSKNEYGGNVNNSFVESEINGVTNWENEEIASYLQMPVNEVAKNREFYVEETQNAMLVNQVEGDYAGGGIIEVVGKGSKGAFRKREYDGMTEKEVADFWLERGYTLSKSRSESKLKPYTFYIQKYDDGGGVDNKMTDEERKEYADDKQKIDIESIDYSLLTENEFENLAFKVKSRNSWSDYLALYGFYNVEITLNKICKNCFKSVDFVELFKQYPIVADAKIGRIEGVVFISDEILDKFTLNFIGGIDIEYNRQFYDTSKGWGILDKYTINIYIKNEKFLTFKVSTLNFDEFKREYIKALNTPTDAILEYLPIKELPKYADGGVTDNYLRKLLPKEKMLKLLKETKFKDFDSSKIEYIEYDTNTYNPFITNFRLTINCFPCIIIIDQISDNAYEVQIAKDDGNIAGIYKDSWEYIFEIPKLNYEEFEKGLKKVINDKIIVLYNYVDFVKTFYFVGTIEEAEKFAKKNGFKNEYDKKRGIIGFYREKNNPSLSKWESTKTYLAIGTDTKREIERSRLDNWNRSVSGGIKKLEKYDDGGDVPHADKMFQLPLEMVIYVPSTQDVDKVISVDKMDKRVDEVKKYLANKFGGYTSADKLGGFVDSTGNLVNEDVVQVTSFSTKEAYAENKEELINQLAKWGEEWGQESIGFEFEGDLMYVPQKFKQGGEVDRFSDYSNDALSDMIINLSRYENTEKEIQIVKAELKKRKGENKDIEE